MTARQGDCGVLGVLGVLGARRQRSLRATPRYTRCGAHTMAARTRFAP